MLSLAGPGALSGSGGKGLGRAGGTPVSGVPARSEQCISLLLGLSPSNFPVAVASALRYPIQSSRCSPTSLAPEIMSAAVDSRASPRGGARDSPALKEDTTLRAAHRWHGAGRGGPRGPKWQSCTLATSEPTDARRTVKRKPRLDYGQRGYPAAPVGAWDRFPF